VGVADGVGATECVGAGDGGVTGCVGAGDDATTNVGLGAEVGVTGSATAAGVAGWCVTGATVTCCCAVGVAVTGCALAGVEELADP
jgi:hypothetical protein